MTPRTDDTHAADPLEAFNGLARTAAAEAQRIAAAMLAESRKVTRLQARRRTLRKQLREVEQSLRESKRWLRGMTADLADMRQHKLRKDGRRT